MRYLAIDFGRRRTGVALSDESGKWAFPHATWEDKSRQQIVDDAVQAARQHHVDAIVLGLPLATEAGREPEMQRPVLVLAQLLEDALKAAQLDVKVLLQDERFSTAVVLGQLREAGISQRTARRADGNSSTDARAAAVILQNFLDRNQDSSPAAS